MKLPRTCNKSLYKCIEDDDELSNTMNKFKRRKSLQKYIIKTCLYKCNMITLD